MSKQSIKNDNNFYCGFKNVEESDKIYLSR